MASPSTAIDFGTNRNLTLNILLSFIAQLLDYDIGTGSSQDIPSDVVEGFIREGFEKIVMADTGWPYYQASYSFVASPTLDIQTLTSSGTTVTATFEQPHGFSNGDLVNISEVTPSGYNGTWTITNPFRVISALTSSGTTATVTTSTAHGYDPDNPPQVIIQNVLPRGYNGTYQVTVLNATQFTYTLSAAITDPVTVLGTAEPTEPTSFLFVVPSPLATVTALGSADSGSAIANTDGRTYNENFAYIIPVTNPPGQTVDIDTLAKITNVVNVTDSGNQLIYIDNYRAEQIWPPNSNNDIAGIPAYWSLWGNSINLWPKPDSVYEMQIMGYRRHSIFWLSDPTLPVDIDPEFHLPLINYVLSRIFQFQEDPEMAAIYMNNYEQGVAMVRGWKTAVSRNQQFILSGGLQTSPYDFYRYMANLSLRAVALGEWS
jgi:hypothetical protein